MPQPEHPRTHEILSEILENLWQAQGHLENREWSEAQDLVRLTEHTVRSELDAWAWGTSGPEVDDADHREAVDGHDEPAGHHDANPRQNGGQQPSHHGYALNTDV